MSLLQPCTTANLPTKLQQKLRRQRNMDCTEANDRLKANFLPRPDSQSLPRGKLSVGS